MDPVQQALRKEELRVRAAARESRSHPWRNGMQRPWDENENWDKLLDKDPKWDVPSDEDVKWEDKDVKFFDVPNPVRHHFLTYLFLSFEGLPSMISKTNEKGFPEDPPTANEANEGWHQDDGIEARYWFGKPEGTNPVLPMNVSGESVTREPTVTPLGIIIDQIKSSLRHGAMHRDRVVSVSLINHMMKLPALLGYHQKAAQVELVWRVVCEDLTVDKEARDWVDRWALTAKRPCWTNLQVLTRIEALLEEALFKWAKREHMACVRSIDDDSPSHRGVRYSCPEDSDLRNWFHLLKFKPPVDLDARIFLQHDLRTTVLARARDLRNIIAHKRNAVDDDDVRRFALTGILLCILIDEQEFGVEIEVLAEQHLTSETRLHVWSRLRHACDDDDDPRRQAILRVFDWNKDDNELAKQQFYARRVMSGGPARERIDAEAFRQIASDKEVRDVIGDAPSRADVERHLQTFQFDKIFYDSAIRLFVRCASMHENLKRDDPEEDNSTQEDAGAEVESKAEPDTDTMIGTSTDSVYNWGSHLEEEVDSDVPGCVTKPTDNKEEDLRVARDGKKKELLDLPGSDIDRLKISDKRQAEML